MRETPNHLDIPVRWGDMDSLGHVNNVVFLRYVEESRIAFLKNTFPQWEQTENVPVVVNINCNFRRELKYPAIVRVSIDVKQASEKRLVMNHLLHDREDASCIFADASVTVVWLNIKTGKSVPLPDEFRNALPNNPDRSVSA